MKERSETKGFLATCAALVLGAAVSINAVDATKRSVFISLVNKSGAPVTDLKAADLEVKEGGKAMEILYVTPATTPMRIAIIDSDIGSGAYQAGVQMFMKKLFGRAEFSLTTVLVQPRKIIDFASDSPTLVKGIDRIGPRGIQRGGQLMEAIFQAAKDIRAEGKRAVILVMRVGGEGTSSMNANDVRAQLRESGAALYVVTVKGADRTPASATMTQTGADAQQMQLRQDELNQGSQQLQTVLGDGSRESGGHQVEVVSLSPAKRVEGLADELLNSYEVVYAVPDGVKPSDKLSISTKRKNVNLYAPNQPPN